MDTLTLIRNILGVVSVVLISCPNESESFVAISWPKGALRPTLWREVYISKMANEPPEKRQNQDQIDGEPIVYDSTLQSTVIYDGREDALKALSSTGVEVKRDEDAYGVPDIENNK